MREKAGSSPDEVMVAGKVVVVAVKASREVPRAALAWALTHVAQPGDCIKLLVIIPHASSKRKMLSFCFLLFLCTQSISQNLCFRS